MINLERDDDLIKRRFRESINAKIDFIEQSENIRLAANAIIKCLKNGGQVFVFGNGGSAADSQHIAGELVGKYLTERKALAVRALTTDTSIITAWSNDYPDGFARVFERQIEGYAKSGDILLGLSTSGNSENIIRAFKKGKEMGALNISLTGNTGGKIRELSDININSTSRETPRIQECHEVAYHIICEIIEKELFSVL